MESSARRQRWARVLIAGTGVLLLGAAWLIGSLLIDSFSARGKSNRPVAALGRKSTDCRACHAEIYRAWADSHHAHAHRPVDATADADALQPARDVQAAGVAYHIGWETGKPQFRATRPNASPEHFSADFVLGYTPLRQYIVPTTGGRYQALDLAFDPTKREWFNVFGAEQRQPGEWGHWTGRGMNWNSMCAHCHLTDFAKHYDAATDTYASTWLEHGVGCVQCHDHLGADHAQPGYKTPPALAALVNDRARNEQTCAPCHARNELLTGEPRPGLAYTDHFRITLPTERATFYPDGQVRDEDFNWTSLLTSRMGGKAGVTCLDCHEPHTGKTRLPAADNQLCLQCHGGPNPKHAPIIDPLAHSHHQAGSTGNQCIACHMPTTTYMQRDPRHDHGFLKPDPLLTKELAIPNACDRCHADKGIDWQIEAADKWYGARLDSRQRQRARVVQAAQDHKDNAPGQLLALIASEDVPAWKATLLQLSRPWAAQADVKAAMTQALSDASPLVRSAAVQALSPLPDAGALLRPALSDPSRLVRVDAEWALAHQLAAGSVERKELDAYLAVSADQPVGQMRLGQDLAARGEYPAAIAALRKATAWDPYSPGVHETLGLILDQAGDAPSAAASLWKAAELEPTSGTAAFNAALAFAGADKLPEAERALREAVRRDPKLDRAWYNLGLLLAQTQRATEGIAALEHAEALAPAVADYPYARATILWGAGNREAARAAAQRALTIDPTHAGARRLLGQ